jgi:hypothetical protein
MMYRCSDWCFRRLEARPLKVDVRREEREVRSYGEALLNVSRNQRMDFKRSLRLLLA